MDALDRSRLLYKLADLIERDHKHLTQLEILGNGGPSPDEYLSEVIKCYRYFAWWASKIHGSTLPDHGPHLCITSREPVGIVGQIISGDFPLLMQAWTLGPALCAGNTVVLKPAQRTPLTALHVASLIKEAGFPPGMVNIVPGDGSTGAAVANHPNINKVVFLGSTEVGHKVLQEARVNSLKVTLCYELGFKGRTGIFVFNNVNLDDVVEKYYFALHLIFYKDQPTPIMYVEESDKDQPTPIMYVEESIYDALLTTMSLKKCNLRKKSCIKFNDINEAIKIATSIKFGFAAIFTNNATAAINMAKNIRAGTICINCFDVFNAQAPHYIPNKL